jgi:hypothetical protein
MTCSIVNANEIENANWILLGVDFVNNEITSIYVDKNSVKYNDAESRYAFSRLELSNPYATLYMKGIYNCNAREKLSLESHLVFNNPKEKHLSSKLPNNDNTWEYVPKGEKLAQKAFDYICNLNIIN